MTSWPVTMSVSTESQNCGVAFIIGDCFDDHALVGCRKTPGDILATFNILSENQTISPYT